MNEQQKIALIKKAREDLEFRDFLLSEPKAAAQTLNITLTEDEIQRVNAYREKIQNEVDGESAPSVTDGLLGGFLDS